VGEGSDTGVLDAPPGDGRTRVSYRLRQRIFSQGDAADAVFCVVRGQVKITVTSAQGKGAVVALVGPGDFFGEGCLLGRAQRPVSATAMTETDATRVDKADMVRLLHADPAFADRFTAHLLARNNRVEADLVDQLLNSSEKRLARTLLLLADPAPDGAPASISAPVTHELLAEMIGSTRPRVSFFMSRFRKLGLIEYNGTLKVRASLLSVILGDTPT
jgi:CRP-like cAMP-binding protein